MLEITRHKNYYSLRLFIYQKSYSIYDAYSRVFYLRRLVWNYASYLCLLLLLLLPLLLCSFNKSCACLWPLSFLLATGSLFNTSTFTLYLCLYVSPIPVSMPIHRQIVSHEFMSFAERSNLARISFFSLSFSLSIRFVCYFILANVYFKTNAHRTVRCVLYEERDYIDYTY